MIRAIGFYCERIDFYRAYHSKTCAFKTLGKAATSGEEIDRVHDVKFPLFHAQRRLMQQAKLPELR